MRTSLDHGDEDRAEEIALHQAFIAALGRLTAAEEDGDGREARRLRPAVERARRRWLAVNKRFVRRG